MNEGLLLWGLGLLAAGLLLVVIEVFVPSGGLIAIAAIGCAVGGVVCLFRYGTTWGLIGLAAVMILGPMAMGFAWKVWPHTPIGRKMLGERSLEEVEAEQLAESKERERLAALFGAEGTVLTDLRPVGLVEIGGKRYEALSDSAFVAAGTRVRVTVVEANQLKVRAIG
ncbi:MAG: NfeD family protein [Phycisphaerales bacterium]